MNKETAQKQGTAKTLTGLQTDGYLAKDRSCISTKPLAY